MTTTLTPGTLTVTLTEAFTLADPGSNDHGETITNVLTIGTLTALVKRIVPIPTTEVGLLSVAADLVTAPGTPQDTYVAGHFDQDTIRYLRITNLDDTNHVVMIFKSSGGAEFAVVLDAGRSFIYGVDNAGGAASTIDASATALTVSLEHLADITAQANTATCQLEVFVAVA